MAGRADKGKTKGQVLFRAAHAGILPKDSRASRHLLGLRSSLTGYLNQASAALFRTNPLEQPEKKLKERAREVAKGSGLHSAWAQELSYKAADAVAAVESQFWKRLRCGLLSCDRDEAVGRRERLRLEREAAAAALAAIGSDLEIAEDAEDAASPPPRRRWTWVPVEVQDRVTPGHFAGIKHLAKDTGWAQALHSLLLADAAKRDAALTVLGLDDVQGTIIAEVYRQALQRYTRPTFAAVGTRATDTFTLQMPNDGRMLEDYTDDLPGLVKDLKRGMDLAWEQKAAEFKTTVRLKAPDNRRGHKVDALEVPLVIRRAVWDAVQRRQAKGRKSEISGFSVEIGPDKVEIKALMALPRITPEVEKTSKARRCDLIDADYDEIAASLNRCDHLLARDVNMVNTTAHALVRNSRTITGSQLRAAQSMGKEEAAAYLGSHLHDGSALIANDLFRTDGDPEVIVKSPSLANPFHHSGRNFLNAVAVHAARIDLLRGEIDDAYNILERRKRILLKPLGLASEAESIPDAYADRGGEAASLRHPDAFVQSLIDHFFVLLARIRQLKALRRDLYRKIDAIKRCWFGWVTNREAELALKWNAAVVREDTDFGVLSVDDEDYRGRTFNRVMNNAARGLLERIASAKLAWLGVPEVRIPCPYTSSTDFRAALVDKAQRKGEVFRALIDGALSHADEHAAVTIALWLLMVFADEADITEARKSLKEAAPAAA